MYLNIPEPCDEDWKKMTPCDKGRHCADCKKGVVDIDQVPERDLLGMLLRGENICARTTTQRLSQLNILMPLLAAGALTTVTDATAQNTYQPGQKTVTKKNTYAAIQLSGTVTDSLSGDPFPGATVTIFSNNQLVAGTITDTAGTYKITLQSSPADSCFDVHFSYMGYRDRILNQLQGKGNFTYPIALASKGIDLEWVDIVALNYTKKLEIIGALEWKPINCIKTNDASPYLYFKIDDIPFVVH